jgi:hypothetical protein
VLPALFRAAGVWTSAVLSGASCWCDHTQRTDFDSHGHAAFTDTGDGSGWRGGVGDYFIWSDIRRTNMKLLQFFVDLAEPLLELLLASVAVGVAMVLLPVLTRGRVGIDWSGSNRAYVRGPNGEILINLELAPVVGLVLLFVIVIGIFAVWAVATR